MKASLSENIKVSEERHLSILSSLIITSSALFLQKEKGGSRLPESSLINKLSPQINQLKSTDGKKESDENSSIGMSEQQCGLIVDQLLQSLNSGKADSTREKLLSFLYSRLQGGTSNPELIPTTTNDKTLEEISSSNESGVILPESSEPVNNSSNEGIDSKLDVINKE